MAIENNNKREYLGVPTQSEIIEQFNYLNSRIQNIITLNDLLKLKNDKEIIDIEVNYDTLEKYNGEKIEVIRYEYKNILAYAYIENDKAKLNECITVYSDDGEQFAEEKFYEYEKVYKMGNLQLI